jgi:2-polyprenyl-3-methyl-5-hydroxy-6-metoxy-1,4-benzoquinol methylase
VSEAARLEDVAARYSGHEGLDATLVRYSVGRLLEHMPGGRCLEMGPADGASTAILAGAYGRVDCVEGSPTLAADLRRRLGDAVAVTCALFEEFAPRARYDAVYAVQVLEHLADPVAVLRRAAEWLAPGGCIAISVPNADSLHRLLGVEMGVLATADAMTERDHLLGHRRVYTRTLLDQHVAAADLEILWRGSSFLKPLANGQLEALADDRLYDALDRLVEHFPDHGADLLVVAQRRTP